MPKLHHRERRPASAIWWWALLSLLSAGTGMKSASRPPISGSHRPIVRHLWGRLPELYLLPADDVIAPISCRHDGRHDGHHDGISGFCFALFRFPRLFRSRKSRLVHSARPDIMLLAAQPLVRRNTRCKVNISTPLFMFLRGLLRSARHRHGPRILLIGYTSWSGL